MPSQLHELAVDVTTELFHEFKKNGKEHYAEVHGYREQRPLVISSPRKGRALTRNFYPDIWAKGGRLGMTDVFEVWDSESEDSAIADILHAALVSQGRWLGILCTGRVINGNDALELCKFLSEKLHGMKGNKILDTPNYTVAQLPSDIGMDRERMKKFIKDNFGF